MKRIAWFQHTAARRRLDKNGIIKFDTFIVVSTHSRPKAAGVKYDSVPSKDIVVSTHSRPKAAGS